MEDCVFCKIVKREVPAQFDYQDEEIVAFRDINPAAPIHVLIVPKKHLESVREVTEADKELLGRLLLIAKKIAEDLRVAQSGYRLSINNGPDAGQIVPHLHIHLLAGRKLALG